MALVAIVTGIDNELAAMRIRLRAERRLGELIVQEQEAGRLAKRSDGAAIRDHVDGGDKVTLSDLGIPRDRSARAQELARVPEDQFEAALASGKPSARKPAWVQEIQVRAVRRAGEMIADGQKNGKLAKRGGDGSNQSAKKAQTSKPSTLADAGISRDDSSRWQKMAKIPEPVFEAAIATAKDQVGARQQVNISA